MKKLLITATFIFLSTTAHAADDQALALAQLTSRMTSIEEENRRLNGRIEELEYQVQQQQTLINKAQAQAAIIAKQAQTVGINVPVPAGMEPLTDNNPVVLGQPSAASPYTNLQHTSADGSAVSKPNPYVTKVEPTAETDAAGADEEFEAIFDSVAAEDYATAKPALKQFVTAHPGTSLAGEAYFWLGEIAWSERDFSNAAINYLKGYKEAPTGDKASENILKMALTLKELGKKEEACKYISRFENEFPTAHRDLKTKANNAKIQLACK